jgi:hypothetical protein
MRQEADDGDAAQFTPMHLTPIDVNVEGLKDFREFLVRELDTNLKPGAQGIDNDHSMGVHFGALNQGVQVHAARDRYEASLRASTGNLAEYVMVAEVLIAAIHAATTKYADADLSAAASVDKIKAALTEAFNTATNERADAIKREDETQRELYRMRAGTNP